MASKRILLIGAGELGTAFLDSLSNLPNHSITLGVRNPARYVHLNATHPTLKIETLDLGAASEQLVELFSTFDIVVSATGFAQGTDAFLRLAQDVLKAGERKKELGKGELWFFPWQWGVDYDITGDGDGLMPLFGVQKKVRDLLRAEAESKNVKWTVVSTGIFMSFLFEPFWGIVERTPHGKTVAETEVTVRALRNWQHKVSVTDVSDIGRVLARFLAGDVDATNRVVYVAGDTVSYGDIADIIQRITPDYKLHREEWSIPHLEEDLSKDPESQIKKYRLVFAKEGVWWEKNKTVNHELGIDMMSVEAYAQKFFKQKG